MEIFAVVKEIQGIPVDTESITPVPTHLTPHERPNFYAESARAKIEVGARLRLDYGNPFTQYWLTNGFIRREAELAEPEPQHDPQPLDFGEAA